MVIEKPDMASRVITGPVLIFTGLVIYTALVLVYINAPVNAPVNVSLFDVLIAILVLEPYSILAGLFVLTGLQYVVGPRAWIDRLITKSLLWMVIISAVIGLVILGAVAVILVLW